MDRIQYDGLMGHQSARSERIQYDGILGHSTVQRFIWDLGALAIASICSCIKHDVQPYLFSHIIHDFSICIFSTFLYSFLHSSTRYSVAFIAFPTFAWDIMAPQEWQNGLCDCSPCESCLLSTFLPCIRMFSSFTRRILTDKSQYSLWAYLSSLAKSFCGVWKFQFRLCIVL